MDVQADTSQAPQPVSQAAESSFDGLLLENATTAFRRDRLLAALVLIAGVGLMLALPFALRAGAEFFLPVTAALVIAIALVPLLEWLERRRVPSHLAAAICVLLFLIVANVAVASIIVPATDWATLLPARIGQIRHNLSPLIDIYAAAERFLNEALKTMARHPAAARRTVTVETPNSLLDLIATSAPAALIQFFFAILVVFFSLSGWTRMRRRTITSRASFSSAMATARVIQEMVDATSAYLAMITLINVTLGIVLSAALWAYGMPTPLMWGGIATLLNYIPYLGPIAVVLLLALGGLMTYPDVWYALAPAAMFVGIHLIEANLITPTLVGRRLTINPLLILVALSYWGWVWGTTGALLAVPLLIILKTVLDAAGKPDIAGFLFEEGTLTSAGPDDLPAGGDARSGGSPQRTA
jgi:predicted PurR-regulated permease PerM